MELKWIEVYRTYKEQLQQAAAEFVTLGKFDRWVWFDPSEREVWTLTAELFPDDQRGICIAYAPGHPEGLCDEEEYEYYLDGYMWLFAERIRLYLMGYTEDEIETEVNIWDYNG